MKIRKDRLNPLYDQYTNQLKKRGQADYALSLLFWRFAQSLSALYPAGTDESRWVGGVLARKKGLGF